MKPIRITRHARYRMRRHGDERGHIVGLEILDASKRLSPSELTSITIEKLPLEVSAR